MQFFEPCNIATVKLYLRRTPVHFFFIDYIVYVDESGDHSLLNIDKEYPLFVLAFCIFRKEAYLELIKKITAFKFVSYCLFLHTQVYHPVDN